MNWTCFGVYVFNVRLVGVYAPARLSTRPRVAGKARPGIILFDSHVSGGPGFVELLIVPWDE